MLEKILKKFGYEKVKEEISEEKKRKLKKLNDSFVEIITYDISKAVKGDK